MSKIFPDGDQNCLICKGTGVIQSVGLNPSVFCHCVLRQRGTILNTTGVKDPPTHRKFQWYSLDDCRDILAWGRRAERILVLGPFLVSGETRKVVTRIDYLINRKLVYSWARGTDVPMHPISHAAMGLAVPSELWSFTVSRHQGAWTASTDVRICKDGTRHPGYLFYGDTEILARMRLVAFLKHIEEYEQGLEKEQISRAVGYKGLAAGPGAGTLTAGGAGGEACLEP